MKQTKQVELQKLIESHVTNPSVQKHMIELSIQSQQEAVEREREKINSLIRNKFEKLEEKSQDLWRLIKNGVEYHRADKNANDVAIMRLREVWREIEALQKEQE